MEVSPRKPRVATTHHQPGYARASTSRASAKLTPNVTSVRALKSAMRSPDLRQARIAATAQ